MAGLAGVIWEIGRESFSFLYFFFENAEPSEIPLASHVLMVMKKPAESLPVSYILHFTIREGESKRGFYFAEARSGKEKGRDDMAGLVHLTWQDRWWNEFFSWILVKLQILILWKEEMRWYRWTTIYFPPSSSSSSSSWKKDKVQGLAWHEMRYMAWCKPTNVTKIIHLG